MWVVKHILNVRRGKYSFLMTGVVGTVLMIGCLTEHINSAAYSCQEQLHNSREASLYQNKSIASTASFKPYLFLKRQCLSSITHNWYINISKMDICFLWTTKATVRCTEDLKNSVQGDIFQMPCGNENVF